MSTHVFEPAAPVRDAKADAPTAGGRASQGGSDAARQIGAWVAQTFTATTVGGTTVYGLTGLRG